jgi:hypothetical protein
VPRGQGESILLRKEDASGGAVGFGNDPDPRAAPEPVAGEEALAGHPRLVVCGRVFRANVAPITSRVAHEIGQVVFLGLGEGLEGAGGRDDLS